MIFNSIVEPHYITKNKCGTGKDVADVVRANVCSKVTANCGGKNAKYGQGTQTIILLLW